VIAILRLVHLTKFVFHEFDTIDLVDVKANNPCQKCPWNVSISDNEIEISAIRAQVIGEMLTKYLLRFIFALILVPPHYLIFLG